MSKVIEATELLCVIPNKPGAVARLTQAVSRTRTNILAMMSWLSATDPDKSYCKMITSNTPKAVQAIKKLGYEVKKYTVLIVNLPNRPGAFYPLAQKIADAGININYNYATTSGTKGQVVLSTNNDHKAMRIIRRCR
ncbi:MAG: hypothetical protein V1709_00120 [Planctomycetota bacterium]